MGKKAQILLKNVAYIGGGAILGYIIFNNITAAIIGGIIGGLISLKW